jgi:hypothetical protein
MIGAFFLAFQSTLIYYFIDNYTGGGSSSITTTVGSIALQNTSLPIVRLESGTGN